MRGEWSSESLANGMETCEERSDPEYGCKLKYLGFQSAPYITGCSLSFLVSSA